MNRVDNYANAYAEVYKILQYLDEEERNKIPQDVLDAIEQSRNEDYVFDIEEDIELKDQVLLTETRAILFNLFRDYLCTPEQKQKIIKMQKEEREKVEEEKRRKYNPDNLFQDSRASANVELKIENDEEKALIKYEKEGIFAKLLKKIKSILNKKI